MIRLTMLFTGLMLGLTAHGESLSWNDIRDGSLYLQPTRNDTLQIDWQPAWQADAATERLFLLDGRGHLQAERRISREQTSGEQRWPLTASDSAYQLEIPGYSFRRYSLQHDDSTRALFAPAKVHFSLEARPNTVLYFRVAAGEQAILAGKYHGGVRGLEVQRLEDDHTLSLPLTPYRAYWQFDRLTLPVADHVQTFRLRLNGLGKAAFWLDGTANLFARRVEHLGPLRAADGEINLAIGSARHGHTPSLGMSVPYVLPPKASYDAIDVVQPHAAGWYSFVDVLQRKPGYELPFRRFYQTRYPIEQDLTLLSGTGRRAVLDLDRSTQTGLDNWLKTIRALDSKALHYLAFTDEPNLSYSDYDSYAEYFQTLLKQVQRFPGASEAGVRIAMPASSNLVNGPMRDHSAERIGLDWARRLLASHADDIDALAWHQWMVRDLLATRVYREDVRQAAELVGMDANGRPRKALLIDQTNISSGSSLSPYEQDTHFAGLWWASVVINASSDGLLDMLNWFHLADEPGWPKGMIEVDSSERVFKPKPVALAHRFIQQHWLPEVLTLDNDGFEVDALAMADAARRSLLGVNKAARNQHISVAGLPRDCPKAELLVFGPDNQPRSAGFTCSDGVVHFTLPGQTLFALAWSVP